MKILMDLNKNLAKVTKQKIREFGWEVLPHPTYSPDIAPSDYHLFRSLQNILENKIFKDIEDVREEVTRFFASKPVSFYRGGIKKLPQRWETIIENDGNYIID